MGAECMAKNPLHRGRQRAPKRPSTPTTHPTRGAAPQPLEVSAWKFEAPTLPERLLPREWLTRQLAHHLGGERSRGAAFLLSAPPGYGKTTVIAQWAQQAGMPV